MCVQFIRKNPGLEIWMQCLKRSIFFGRILMKFCRPCIERNFKLFSIHERMVMRAKKSSFFNVFGTYSKKCSKAQFLVIFFFTSSLNLFLVVDPIRKWLLCNPELVFLGFFFSPKNFLSVCWTRGRARRKGTTERGAATVWTRTRRAAAVWTRTRRAAAVRTRTRWASTWPRRTSAQTARRRWYASSPNSSKGAEVNLHFIVCWNKTFPTKYLVLKIWSTNLRLKKIGTFWRTYSGKLFAFLYELFILIIL